MIILTPVHFGKWTLVRDIEAELTPKINPKIHSLNFAALA